MFCSIFISLHNSRVNFDVNQGSQLLMILLGSPKLVTTCLRYNAAVSSALISSLHGMNITAFVQLWSVTVRIESYPCERGNLVMKSIATVLNGIASGFGYMGLKATFVGQLLTLCC